MYIKLRKIHWGPPNFCIYTGCPKKSWTLDFRYFAFFENIAYFDFIRKNIVFWKEWYQDHLICFGSSDSTTISWNTVIYKFC